MNEITVKKQKNYVFVPKDLDQAMNYAAMIASSSFCPKSFNGKPGDVLVAMQMGAEVGLSPMQALQNISVINGRPSLWGDAALAVVMASHNYISHKEWIEGSSKDGTLIAYCSVTRRGSEEYIASFSMDQAKKAQLWSKPGVWQQYPERMLQMRARSFALRDKFADALRGLSIAEEAQDIVEVSVVGTQTNRKEHAASHLNNLISEKKVNNEINNLKIKIDHCLDVNSLSSVGSLIASSSLSEDEKTELRSYYKKKHELLSANKETGEIIEQTSNESLNEYENIFDDKNNMYEKVKKQLLKAKSRDTLDIAADMIREWDPSTKDELIEIYNKRQEEVK